MPQGKAAKQELEQKIKNMYLSGDVDPLQVEIGVKGVEEAVKAIRKDYEVRDAVMSALSMYNEKTVELIGAQVTKKNMPARYDFSGCGDPQYDRLNEQMQRLKEQLKDRENFLKTIKGTEVITDKETGETVEVREPVKTQGETYAIKFI